LIEDIKHNHLSEEDYIEYLKTEMKQASDYNKDIMSSNCLITN